MGRAKYKPAVRRVKRQLVDEQKAIIDRWSEIAKRHSEGSVIHSKALRMVKLAEDRLAELRTWDTP